jgi:hypothetical protein
VVIYSNKFQLSVKLQNFCVFLYVVCFVSLSALFVWKCVLYYCHRVATQLQLTNISHHIIYHIISHRITYHISYHIISYYNSLSRKMIDKLLLRANCIVMIFLGVGSNVRLHTVNSV